MRSDIDLALFRRSAGHLLVAKGTQLERIGGNRQLATGGMIDAGGYVLKLASDVTPTGRLMTNLALHDLPYIGTVVHACEPFGIPIGMA